MYKHTYTVISPYKYSHTHPQIMFYRTNWPIFFFFFAYFLFNKFFKKNSNCI